MRSFAATLRQLILLAVGAAFLTVCCVLYRAFILGMPVNVSPLLDGRVELVIVFFMKEAVLTISGMSFAIALVELRFRADGLRTADGRVGTLLALMVSLGVAAVIAYLCHRGTTKAEMVASPVAATVFSGLGYLTLANAMRRANYRPDEAIVIAGPRPSTYQRMKQREYRETEDW